jgi:hypothetical protein
VNSVKLSLPKRVLVSAWLGWERFFHALFGVKPIDAGNGILYYRVCRYHGRPISLPDEEEIAPGDRVVEFHLNNRMLFQLVTESRSMMQLAVQLIQLTTQLMPKMADIIVHDPACRAVKGIYGITMIHRGARQLGFTVQELPRGWFATITRFYLKTLLYVIHPDGKKRLELKQSYLRPKVLAISTNELLQRYPVHPAP